MEIADIVKYVRETPDNTNPAVIASMCGELGGSGGSTDPISVTFKLTGAGDEQRIDIMELFVDYDGHKTYWTYSLDSATSEVTVSLYASPYYDEYYTCFCAIGNTSNISNYALTQDTFNRQYLFYYDEDALYISFGQLVIKDGDTIEITIESAES